MATTIVLVRHGETVWNRAGRIQGQTDSELTREGVLQAESVGRRLASMSFDGLWSSDLGRAHHTAAVIAQHVGARVQLESRFRERGFGIAEGKTYAEIDRDFPEMFSRVRDTDPDFSAPGGESRRQFSERVTSALTDYANTHAGKSILVVTHGGVLAALFRWLSGLPIASPHKIEIPNAAFNELLHDHNGWKIKVWGDVAHLPERTDSDPI
jgi:probable phosphoglycerate mutase